MRRVATGLVLVAGLYLAISLAGSQSAKSLPPLGAAVFPVLLVCILLAAASTVVWRRYRGRSDLVLTARDGSVQVQPEWPASRPFRQRIPVVVQEGHAAVVERRGRFSRVLLPGLNELSAGESISRVIVTRPRKLVGSADCTTRDGVPVALELEIEARVSGAGGAVDNWRGYAPQDGQPTLAANEELLRQSVALAAHQTPSWEMALLQSARGATCDVISRTPLNEIYDFRAANRFAFPFAVLADRVRSQLDESTAGWGIAVSRLTVGRVRLPPPIVDRVVSAWMAANPLPSAPSAPIAPVEPPEDRPAGGSLRLFPVVGYGPAGSLREMLRHRLGDVTVESLKVGSEHCVPVSLAGDAPIEYLLRPGVSSFVLQVGPGGLDGAAIIEGDYVICEPGDSVSDGSVAAIALDGRILLGRATRHPDHLLLATDSADRLTVVLTEPNADLDAIQRLVSGIQPEPLLRPLRDARVLGQGVVALKRVGTADGSAPTDSLDTPSAEETDISETPVADQLALSCFEQGGSA